MRPILAETSETRDLRSLMVLNRGLRRLLMTPQGQTWLQNSDKRHEAVDFLMTRRGGLLGFQSDSEKQFLEALNEAVRDDASADIILSNREGYLALEIRRLAPSSRQKIEALLSLSPLPFEVKIIEAPSQNVKKR